MMVGEFWELGHVGDRDLERDLLQLLANGSRTEARMIAHLAAVEERRLHLEAGSSSLFGYCCTRLGLSENEAFHRITAARLARRFPVIFGLIERREIHLSAICLLRDYLTPENHPALLAEASGKTKLQVLELLARRFPRPDVASTIRKLPGRRAAGAEREAFRAGQQVVGALAVEGSSPPESTGGRGAREQVVEPLSAGRYRIQLSASAQLREKLMLALDLLSHANPTGDLAMVIERALDVLIERVQKQRFAQTKRPHRDRAAQAEDIAKSKSIRFRSRRGHIPNATKRQIAARDELRCTFVSADGKRCDATRFAQIHHEEAWAHGGGDTPDNLRILCAAHNRLLAERDFGRQFVARRVEARRVELKRSELDESRGRGQERREEDWPSEP